jgi:xylan 1,4-beta-xylosidase
MRQTRVELGFQQVRFHGLFVDDMSVVLPDDDGLLFSFFNIDRIFDFFVEIGMKPFVEIGFMPKLLASGNQTWSHYDAHVTPPKNWTTWSQLITAFGRHLIDRYGEEEVLTWNFEVWNEPNCCPHDFWTGSQKDYFYLFEVTSRALKSVDPRFRVGGPATAMSAWIPEFLDYCTQNKVPLDFISTHEYPTDPPGPQTRTFFINHLRATRRKIPPTLPLYYTEYDDGYNDPSSYSAAFIVYQNYLARGTVQALSWWPFSDLFEEGGLYPTPFPSSAKTFMPVDGLMNVYGIPKPSYRAFQLLHWTGNELLKTTPDTFESDIETLGVFAVGGNGTSVFLVNWNVKNQPITDRTVKVEIFGFSDPHLIAAQVFYVDSRNTTALPAWSKMGMPEYITAKQVAQLKIASELVPVTLNLEFTSNSVSFVVTVEANSLVNVVLNNKSPN